MRIVETRLAPNPRRVRIFLAEKGVTIAFEEHDLMAGDFQTAEFRRLNPWQRVPVLVFNDGRVLAETIAICRYFESEFPEPALFGRGAFDAATVEMWQRRVELGLFFHIAQVFRHLHPKMAHLEVPQVPDWGKANQAKISIELEKLDDRLAQCQFIAGREFSVADITALVAIDFMKPAKLEKPNAYLNIMRWYSDVSQRPSASA